MLSWFSAAGLAVLALSLITVPGWALGWALAFRGFRHWSLAPVLGIGAQSISAIAAAGVHVPWNAATTLGCAAIWTMLGVAGALVRRRLAPTTMRETRVHVSPAARAARRRTLAAAAAGLAVAIVVFVVDVAIPVGRADSIGQSVDSLFHYDLVEWILRHQDAAATHVGALSGSTATSTFYPDAWHTVVAFLVAATGCPIALAASAMTIVVTLVIWPLGVVALATELFGRRPAVVGAALALSGAATAFPWHLIDWGILYPNTLSLSMMMSVVALAVHLALDRSAWTVARTLEILALPILGVALAIAQPNALFTAAILLLPVGVVIAWRVGARRRRRGSVIATVLFILVFGAGWAALYKLPLLTRVVAVHWPVEMTPPQALGEAVLSGFDGNPGQFLVPLLSVVGIVAILIARRRAAWFVAAYAITVGMYVVNASLDGRVRQWLTGFWYTDERRLAANAAIVAVVLAVGGAVWTFDRVPWNRVLPGRANPAQPAIAALVLTALIGTNLFIGGHVEERRQLTAAYRGQPLLTTSEAAFLDRVEARIGSRGVIANIPSDGSGFGYALNGLHLLHPVMEPSLLEPWTPDELLVGRRLNEIATRPDVCAAAHRLGLHYALNLDRDLFFDADDRPEFAGLRIAPGTPGFTPLIVDGERGLYRIDDC